MHLLLVGFDVWMPGSGQSLRVASLAFLAKGQDIEPSCAGCFFGLAPATLAGKSMWGHECLGLFDRGPGTGRQMLFAWKGLEFVEELVYKLFKMERLIFSRTTAVRGFQ